MKKYKNFLFVPYSGHKGTYGDVSDGYLNEACGGNGRIKLENQIELIKWIEKNS